MRDLSDKFFPKPPSESLASRLSQNANYCGIFLNSVFLSIWAVEVGVTALDMARQFNGHLGVEGKRSIEVSIEATGVLWRSSGIGPVNQQAGHSSLLQVLTSLLFV